MKVAFVVLILASPAPLCRANNIAVDDVVLSSQDLAGHSVRVTFDLSWENSWRSDGGAGNWDAAWVFAKFRVGGGEWHHVTLDYVNGIDDGHVAPAGVTVRGVPGGTGVFVHRSGPGSGDVAYPDIGLRWHYGDQGLADDDPVDLRVYAVEMVYVAGGAFYVGNPDGTERNTFRRLALSGGFPPELVTQPYRVGSEGEIQVGAGVGELNYDHDEFFAGDWVGPVPAAFPKGFAAFYCMKYEFTQGQWVSFFNTLTAAQKDRLHWDLPYSPIQWAGGDHLATAESPDRPFIHAGWLGMQAYLDWAGLRLMTELEFEKACRGPEYPVPGEFAWGNADPPPDVFYSFSWPGTSIEMITNARRDVPNAACGTTIDGNDEVRVGIFAASVTKPNRVNTGASYWGIMELSGNAFETVASVGDSEGRAFTGIAGDGELAADGSPDVEGWPTRFGYRGGGLGTPEALRVSDRSLGGSPTIGPSIHAGFRGVRTAP
jgi:formylglycine-generating enzyme required for sulfatase activity